MEENQDFNLLPPYLVDSDGAQSPESQTQRTYGTLSYNARRAVALPGNSRLHSSVTMGSPFTVQHFRRAL